MPVCVSVQGIESKSMTEVILQKVEFKEITICESIFMINRKRLVFHGVNRHECSALNGRCVSKESNLILDDGADFREMVLDRIQSMYQRDKDHANVVK